MFLSRVSFTDMLAQAQAQDEAYTVEEESDEDLEANNYEYEDRYEDCYEGPAAAVPPLGAISSPETVARVSAGDCPTQQACGVSLSGPGADTSVAGTQDRPPQQALGSGGSGARTFEAGKADDTEGVGLGKHYTTEQGQQPCRTYQGSALLNGSGSAFLHKL